MIQRQIEWDKWDFCRLRGRINQRHWKWRCNTERYYWKWSRNELGYIEKNVIEELPDDQDD